MAVVLLRPGCSISTSLNKPVWQRALGTLLRRIQQTMELFRADTIRGLRNNWGMFARVALKRDIWILELTWCFSYITGCNRYYFYKGERILVQDT